MEADHPYGMADLGQHMIGRAMFPSIPSYQDPHRGLSTPPYVYADMIMFRQDNAGAAFPIGDETCEGSGGLSRGGDGGAVVGRWPRQETLALLEIRSRLDSKFKQANQKGPLWDEVSRIMSEKHAYQRSGKKCREKFENLYKYYKKSKKGKSGRQDGKHYRFFRQLEALYGETSNSNNSASVSEINFYCAGYNPNMLKISTSTANNQESYLDFSLPKSCDFDPTSSADSENDPWIDHNNRNKGKRRRIRGWKLRIKHFIDKQMMKLMDKQEAWMEKMMKSIEHREKERIVREEEWRKQDAERMERQRNLWASERAWIEARDASLLDTLHKMTRKGSAASPQEEEMVADIRSLSKNCQNDDGSETINNPLKCDVHWPEHEVSRLIQLRHGVELNFQKSVITEQAIWEETASKIDCCGYEKSGLSY